MIRLFSLIKSLYVRSGHKLLKCVSPLLMGAVLALFVPVDALAYTSNTVITIPEKKNGSFYTELETMGYIADNENAGKSVELVFDNLYLNVPTIFTYQYTDVFGSNNITNTYTDTTSLAISNVKMHLIVNNKEYILDPFRVDVVNNSSDGSYVKEYNTYRFSQPGIKDIKLYSDLVGSGRVSILYFFEIITSQELNIIDIKYEQPNRHEIIYKQNYPLNCYRGVGYTYSIGKSGVSSVDYDNATIDSIERNTVQIQQYHNLDRSDAEQAGSDMTGFASQLDNLKNTWSILWYPIEFTNRFIQVFVGGTQAAAYQDDFAYITGYTYNDEIGFLEPIMARSVQPASAGTGITFPAFSLMGYQIWDSYTYDLSQVKDQLPAVFDALYVIISILEMLWFVGYLRKKYEEVFG